MVCGVVCVEWCVCVLSGVCCVCVDWCVCVLSGVWCVVLCVLSGVCVY